MLEGRARSRMWMEEGDGKRRRAIYTTVTQFSSKSIVDLFLCFFYLSLFMYLFIYLIICNGCPLELPFTARNRIDADFAWYENSNCWKLTHAQFKSSNLPIREIRLSHFLAGEGCSGNGFPVLQAKARSRMKHESLRGILTLFLSVLDMRLNSQTHTFIHTCKWIIYEIFCLGNCRIGNTRSAAHHEH